MNYLGHAYIARNHPELIAGNFAGDSYKGNLDKFNYLPLAIVNGIRLHRFIDHYTDHSVHIVAAAKLLQDEGVKRIAFIATDILLDHFLAKYWSDYHETKYENFVEWIYANTDPHLENIDDEFDFLYIRIKKYGWMLDYNTEEGIQKILRQFSKRMQFENSLTEAFAVYKKHEETFRNHFSNFLIDIDKASAEFISTLPS